jgi:hypothetical protein
VGVEKKVLSGGMGNN